MTGQYSARDYDWALVLLSLSLVALGVIEIYSATRDTAWQDSHSRQLVWIGVGLLVLWLVSMIDYGWLVEHAPVFYVAGMLGLLGVALLAEPVAGARRWLPLLGGASIQISELVKVMLVLLMARFFSKLGQERPSLGSLAKIAGLFAVPALLVAKQPDLSTALTYMSILAVGIFVAGVNWRYVAVAGLAAILLLPIGWHKLEPYQRDRITTFLDPEQDPRGTGYQPIQSKIAVGSGEIWGKGFAQGPQTQLRFLPVPHTDFIFSAYAEETGFVGVALALTLYFAMLMRIVNNAQTAADAAGMYICMGVAALLLFHIFVNISMVIGRMPVTGLPLPLMSYGGSSTITTFALLGLVNNVRLHRFTN